VETFEDKVYACIISGIAVEMLVRSNADDTYNVGIRLRTYGKNLPRDKMVLADGDSFGSALDSALEKAKARRWEKLDWAARPWTVPTRDWAADNFGL